MRSSPTFWLGKRSMFTSLTTQAHRLFPSRFACTFLQKTAESLWSPLRVNPGTIQFALPSAITISCCTLFVPSFRHDRNTLPFCTLTISNEGKPRSPARCENHFAATPLVASAPHQEVQFSSDSPVTTNSSCLHSDVGALPPGTILSLSAC